MTGYAPEAIAAILERQYLDLRTPSVDENEPAATGGILPEVVSNHRRQSHEIRPGTG